MTTDVDHHDPTVPIAVYGTLRPGGRFWWDTLANTTVERRLGLLEHATLYRGPGYPLVRDDPDGPGAVTEVHWVHPTQRPKVLAALDRIEGYLVDDPSGGLYERVTRIVWFGGVDGPQPVDAVVYVATATHLRTYRQPVQGGDWVADQHDHRIAWEQATGEPYPVAAGVADLRRRLFAH